MNILSRRYAEYEGRVKDILYSPSMERLKAYNQHMGTSRFTHSLAVSYKSYIIARLLGWNSLAVARAGLMHDMFYYNFRDAGFTAREHCRIHPKIALNNAKRNFTVSDLESEIILDHMFLASWTPPRHKEAYLVTMVDKYCATAELFKGLFTKLFPAA